MLKPDVRTDMCLDGMGDPAYSTEAYEGCHHHRVKAEQERDALRAALFALRAKMIADDRISLSVFAPYCRIIDRALVQGSH